MKENRLENILNNQINDQTCAYIDMHCDTLLRTVRYENETLYDGKGMQSLRQMQEAGQKCQFFAVFFPPREELTREPFWERPDVKAVIAEAFPRERSSSSALRPEQNVCHWQMATAADYAGFSESVSYGADVEEKLWKILTQNLRREVSEHSDIIAMARTASEIEENFRAGKMSAVLTIEDGRMVNGNMERLIALREEGVCAIALTWNFANCFGSPNSKDPAVMNTGLTSFGKEAVEVMNDIGILIDVSHLSDGGFWDVVKLSKKPFVATHSNCRAISPHQRNLTDEMIRVLAQRGGVSGLNFSPDFLSPDLTNQVTRVELLADHVMHFIKIGGEDCVGLGTDFDGIEGSFEIGYPAQMYLLFEELSRRGLSQRQLDKIKSGNVLRVMREGIG
ncbi:MAG: dipeptidase [Lachnospiraceae bacterium]|nr:dipeptidase [Lachnospiraceae bacterium]